MHNSTVKKTVVFVILTGLFGFGLAHLFQVRFAAGDLYPPYSSLRTDPLGARALFEAIEKSALWPVSRNYAAPDRMVIRAGMTVLVLGLSGGNRSLDDPAWDVLFDNLHENGGRLVISFPSMTYARKKETEKKSQNGADKAVSDEDLPGKNDDSGSGPSKTEDTGDTDPVAAPGWNGLETLGLAFMPVNADNPKGRTGAERQDGDEIKDLAASIYWPPTGCFTVKDPSWKVLYTQQDAAVVLEKEWGKGGVTLLSDSYVISNQGLQEHREPVLLAWLVGDAQEVVFDEFHHGLSQKAGVVDLIKKYRLQGVVMSLCLFAALLVWRQVALVPVLTKETVTGRHPQPGHGPDSLSGWVMLARAHILPKDLLAVCHSAWQNSDASGRVSQTLKNEIQTTIQNHTTRYGKQSNSVVYQKVYRLIRQGKLP